MNNEKKVAAARLKFVSWNAGKKPIIPSLGDEIERKDLNTLHEWAIEVIGMNLWNEN